uniref:Protein FAM136A n=1 Tax=Eptatretus burgeri TaxID=7764 RepID=A0A8C4Q5Q2_EPTBU
MNCYKDGFCVLVQNEFLILCVAFREEEEECDHVCGSVLITCRSRSQREIFRGCAGRACCVAFREKEEEEEEEGGDHVRGSVLDTCCARSRKSERSLEDVRAGRVVRVVSSGLISVNRRVMANAVEMQEKVNTALNEMLETLDKEHIRKMQARMFRCSAECCDSIKGSTQTVRQCIDRCNAPLTQGHALFTAELQRFQERLQRCAIQCNDKAQDAHDLGSSKAEAQTQLESCVTSCGKEHLELLPGITRRLQEAFSNVPH